MARTGSLIRRPSLEVDPFRLLWRLFTSVRFALALVGFLATACMIGILVPQVPTQMIDNPAAMSAWHAAQEERFGAFAAPMRQLGAFDVFRSAWFIAGLGTLVMSVSVCTANRIAPIWRNVTQPQLRVGNEYFDRDQSIRASIADVSSLVCELQRRRYCVKIMPEGATTYLFADRFPWSQFATFVSHLALILFLAAGFVTILTARDVDILIAEGESLPVFSLNDPDHMQVAVEDAVGRFDDTGFPLDYRTKLSIYQGGSLVKEGVTTVNDPLTYDGYKFHQTAYFPDGAALEVRDVSTGRLIFSEVLALTARAPAPRVEIRDANGALLVDDVIFPTDFIAGASGSVVAVPGTPTNLWVGTQRMNTGEFRLVVFRQGSRASDGTVVAAGQSTSFNGLQIRFSELTDVASLSTERIPGATGATTVEMVPSAEGNALVLTPLNGFSLVLGQDKGQIVGNYEYIFRGQREFAGVTVRRDAGATIVWIATGVFLVGLAMTFYLPRRRLWVRIADGEATFRGLGGSSKAIEREIRQVSRVDSPIPNAP